MYQHQDNKYNREIEMDVTPFVPGHGPQGFDLFACSLAAAKTSAVPAAGAGRKDVLDNKAGYNQTQKADKT